MLSNPRVVFGAPLAEASVPRPLKMYIPNGPIKRAWHPVEAPYAGVRSRRSGAQKAGLAYQKKVGRHLLRECSDGSVVDGPWFAFTDASPSVHFCQPDYIIDRPLEKEAVVAEVKIRWTSDAWWQLRKLYLPVVQCARPELSLLCLCITRSYDPAVCIPEEINLIDDLSGIKPEVFNVLVLR